MGYQKQNFVSGQVLNSAHLNHIENGIADVESTAKATKTVVDKIIDPNLSLSGKAADAKATGDAVGVLKEDIQNLSEIDNINISQLQNGGEYRYQLKWNNGGYIGNHYVSSSEVDGEIISYNGWSYTDAIPVVAGTEIKIVSDATSGRSQNAFYKQDGSYDSSVIFNKVVIVPQTAAFLKLSKRNDFNAYAIVYGKGINSFADKDTFMMVLDKTKSNTDVLDHICGNSSIIDFEWIDGEYVNTDSGYGAFTPYDGWHRTGYIPIQPTEHLHLVATSESATQLYNAFYRSDKSYIGKFLVNKETADSIDVPCDARYFALSTNIKNDIKRKIYTDLSLENLKNNLGINNLNAILEKKKQSFEWKGNLRPNSDIDTGYGYSPKVGLKFGFYAEFSTFDSITIQLDAYSPNCIVVDKTNVTLKSRFMEDVILPHGIDISGHIMFNAICSDPNNISVSISSNGVQNTVTGAFSVTAYEKFHLINGNSALTNCIFTFGCNGINSNIWAIGDSYFGATNPARWVYWMFKNGFNKNTLFCGSTGSGENEAEIWINSLFNQGTPKMLVWAHGMNYASDGTDAPASGWLNETEKLIKKCTDLGVEIILCTIPSVPSKNHEQKNLWVRNSGYRYIDFAKAVGADASGTWYTGMLSSDNVHPSESGAIALYNMALASVPEFTQ